MKEKLINAYSQLGKEIRIKVSGTSMMPLIRDDSLISADLSPGRLPRTGEICVFKNAGGYVVHRVIKVVARQDSGQTVIENGDACMNFTVRKTDSILGIVTSVKSGERIISYNSSINKTLNLIYGYYWLIVYKCYNVINKALRNKNNRFCSFLIKAFSFCVIIIFRCMTMLTIYKKISYQAGI